MHNAIDLIIHELKTSDFRGMFFLETEIAFSCSFTLLVI